MEGERINHACNLEDSSKSKKMARGHREKRYSLSIIRDVSKLSVCSGDFSHNILSPKKLWPYMYKSNELGQHPKVVLVEYHVEFVCKTLGWKYIDMKYIDKSLPHESLAQIWNTHSKAEKERVKHTAAGRWGWCRTAALWGQIQKVTVTWFMDGPLLKVIT